MADGTIVRWRVLFSGSVQHVGFRYTAYYLARGLSLTGWVNNRYDGSVEMEVQGEVARIRKMLLQLKSKPQLRILSMEIEEIPPVPRERRFEVRGV